MYIYIYVYICIWLYMMFLVGPQFFKAPESWGTAPSSYSQKTEFACSKRTFGVALQGFAERLIVFKALGLGFRVQSVVLRVWGVGV